MSLSLYFDENVNGAIFAGLRRKGIDVRRVQDEGQSETPDPLILDRALANGWVVFTMDRDFLIEASERLMNDDPFAGVIYSEMKGHNVRGIIEDLKKLADEREPEEFANFIQYLPLRK